MKAPKDILQLRAIKSGSVLAGNFSNMSEHPAAATSEGLHVVVRALCCCNCDRPTLRRKFYSAAMHERISFCLAMHHDIVSWREEIREIEDMKDRSLDALCRRRCCYNR